MKDNGFVYIVRFEDEILKVLSTQLVAQEFIDSDLLERCGWGETKNERKDNAEGYRWKYTIEKHKIEDSLPHKLPQIDINTNETR